jgi:hypothetical protein
VSICILELSLHKFVRGVKFAVGGYLILTLDSDLHQSLISGGKLRSMCSGDVVGGYPHFFIDSATRLVTV